MAWRALWVVVLGSQLVSIPVVADGTPGPEGVGRGRVATAPLAFVENRGPWESDVSFAAYRLGATALLGPTGIELGAGDESGGAPARVRLVFDGAAPTVPRGEEPLETAYRFHRGPSPAAGCPAARGFRSVLYEALHPGISVRVRGSESGGASGRLAYDVILEAGAPLEAFAVRCEGIDRIEVEPPGDLVLEAGAATMRHAAPIAWQELPGGERLPVDARFVARDGCAFGFEVEDLDPALPCVIDPCIQFGTCFGGAGEDFAFDVASTEAGDVVVAGFSTGVAGTGGRYDAWVAVFDAGLANLRSLTTLGGSGDDRATTLALLPGGDVLVGGWTASGDFPTTEDAPDPTWGGQGDGFVAVVDPAEGSLVFSTFVGGALDDAVTSVAVDPEGRALVAGHTFSPAPESWFDAPAEIGFQIIRKGPSDAFLCRLDLRAATGDPVPVDYFTLLGGTGLESRSGEYFDESRTELRRNAPKIALLPDGTVAVAGKTTSSDFPTTWPCYQASLRGMDEIFVSRILPDASLAAEEQLVYSTYLGGSSDWGDDLLGVDADPDGNVWLTGYTWSPSFPTTANALQRVLGGEDDVIVACIAPDPELDPADQLRYSSFFGGSVWEWGHDIAVEPDGSVTVVGYSESANIPLSEPATSSGFILHLKPAEEGDPGAMRVAYAVRVGYGYPVLTGVLPAAGGKYHVVGYANGWGPTLPPGGYQPEPAGGYDVAVLGVDFRVPAARCVVTPTSGRVPLEVSADASESQGVEGTSIVTYRWDFGDGATAEGPRATHTYTTVGRHVVTLTVTTDVGSWDAERVEVFASCEVADDGPWTSGEIGEPWLQGSASWSESPDGGCLTLCAGGRTLAGTSDALYFVHRPESDGFVLTARIDEARATTLNGQVGLMARVDLEDDSSFGAVTFRTSTQGAIRFAYRDGKGARIQGGSNIEIEHPFPVWLRLTRSGDRMVGEYSADGSSWTVAGSGTFEVEAPLALELEAGIVGQGLLPSTIVRAEPLHALVCGIRVEPYIPIERFTRCDVDADGQWNLTDAVGILGYLFLGEDAPTCLDAADCDDTGELEVTDAIRLLGYLFLGAEEPPPPFAECGADPSEDALDCADHAVCG